MNSSGSAMEENAKWMDSIEGKTYQFTNALETMWSNMLDSEVIKGFIDFGTGAIKFLDTAPGKITAIVAALGGFAKFKGFSLLGLSQETMQGLNHIKTAYATLANLKQVIPASATMPTDAILQYSSAVSHLTAKQQANMLAAQGLNKLQIQQAMQYNNLSDDVIREATAHVFAASATEQETAAGTQLFAVKVQNEVASLRAMAAIANETMAKQLNAAADALETSTTKEAAKAKLDELLATNAITPSIHAEAMAKLGLTTANTGLAASFKALFTAMGPIGWISLALSAIPIITQFVDAIHVSVEELKEEVNELKDTYAEAKETFEDNLETLTTSSDTKLYDTLQDEFEALARGVDKYGNNISLTSDQYERYKDICEKIVGINPKIAAGYENATEAIGNNVNILSELIELQKMQSRNNAKEYVSDENLEAFVEDAWNDVDEANDKVKYYESYILQQKKDIDKQFAEKFMQSEFVQNFNPEKDYGYNAMLMTLQLLGKDLKSAQEELQKYFFSGTYDSSKFFADYMQEIYENAYKFTEKNGENTVHEFFESMELDGMDYEESLEVYFGLAEEADDAAKELERAQDGLIDVLLNVPYSTKYYENLGDESQNFLVNWIKNSPMFKIDESWNKTERQEKAKEMRDTIIEMIEFIADDANTVSFNGEQVTGQDLLDKFYNFDMSSVNWVEYQNQIGNIIETIWKLIGGEDNKFGFKNAYELSVALGFDIQEITPELQKAFDIVKQRIDVSADEMTEFLNGLTAAEVQAFYQINWNDIDPDNSDTKQEILDVIHNKMNDVESVISVKTYSVIVEEIEAYNEAILQTSEIVSDNTIVTQEYKDTILALGVSEAELNKCFDENNKLIVKDAKALNDLVKSAKKHTAQNIKLAKSQAKLDYYELYKEMRKCYDAQGNLISGSNKQVLALYQEMNVLQKTISEYSRLETQLLGTVTAYEKFQDAQEADAATDYISGIEEMVLALGEAFNTAELGTETAQITIETLVHPSVYDELDTVDDKVAAIYSYFKDGPISQYFTLEFDDDGAITSAEMKVGNLRKFIEDGLWGDVNGDGMNVFEGADWQHFEFSKAFLAEVNKLETAEERLQYFADQFKVTKDVAFAIIESINDHDAEWLNGDYASLFDTFIPRTLNDDIYDTIDALSDLNAQLARGDIKPSEYAEEYAKLNGELDNLGDKARDQIKTQQELTAQLEEQQKIMQDATSVLNSNASEAEKTTALTTLTKATEEAQRLSNLLNGIEIDEFTIQFAIDNIDEEIATIERALANKVAFTGEGKYKINVSLTGAELKTLEKYEQLWAERHNIEVNTDPDDAQTALELIESAAQNALDVIDSIDGTTIIVNTSSAVRNVNELTTALKNLAGVETSQVTIKAPEVSGTSNGALKGNNWQSRHFMQTALASGTAHASGDWGLPASEHNALVGELGKELIVDPLTSRYYTVGNTGAEMVDIPKGAIIFNHKQTESLLKNGHIASRGKAYAEGNAHVTIWPNGVENGQWAGTPYDNGSGDEDQFEDVIDWIEILMEEHEEVLSKLSAELENAATWQEKNNKINEMIARNQKKLADSEAGAKYYEDYAAKYLSQIPAQYREMAQNGAIAIKDFVGDANEEVVEAIQKYRDYIQKAADLTQQAEETLTEIRDLTIQKIDNIQTYGDAKTAIEDAQTNKLQNAVDLIEESGNIAAAAYYQAMMENSSKKIEYWKPLLDSMQAELDQAVRDGTIVKGSVEWYEQLSKLYEIQAAIDEATIELEEFQNAINDIYWDNFDQLINRLGYLKDETQSLIDLMSHGDLITDPTKSKHEGGTVEYWTADDVNWTDEGLASLGLYAQQMEIAEYTARQYAEAIKDLEADYAAGLYSESEYLEKLNELKEAQYDSIQSYNEAKEAIQDLNKTRIDSIKDGISKEIDAYSELIGKKKELLDSEKD